MRYLCVCGKTWCMLQNEWMLNKCKQNGSWEHYAGCTRWNPQKGQAAINEAVCEHCERKKYFANTEMLRYNE